MPSLIFRMDSRHDGAPAPAAAATFCAAASRAAVAAIFSPAISSASANVSARVGQLAEQAGSAPARRRSRQPSHLYAFFPSKERRTAP